jgi:hypothetical protein
LEKRKKEIELFFLCYPSFNRMGGSYQGPMACTAGAEIIGTIFEEHIVAVGILKHICDTKNSRMAQINNFNTLLVFPFFKD